MKVTITIEVEDPSQVAEEIALLKEAMDDNTIDDYERMDGSYQLNKTTIEVEDEP